MTEEIKKPTELCVTMVAVPKKNGQIRICSMSKNVVPTIDDIVPRLVQARVFSLLDAASCFWQLPLDKDSAKPTTFIMPFG